MKIIIPASGTGERFKRAGYKDTKPLINVTEDKKIIDYVFQDVFDCYNTEDEFFVISSPETFDEMDKHLKDKKYLCAHILYDGEKLGPVGAIQGSIDELENYFFSDDEVIISYCDYGMKWNYSDFLEYIKDEQPDGCIPCYSGYHPHLENENNVYAACKMIDEKVWKVREKYKSKKRFEELWSPGLYYFNSFNLMKSAFCKMIKAKDTLNKEYYVSLSYNHIDINTTVYPKIDQFYQFGTPIDFEYAKKHINMRDNIRNNKTEIENTIILSAGKGERFLNLGFQQPKPFLPLGETDLISNITNSFNPVNTKIQYVGSDAHKIFWRNYAVQYVPDNKIGAAYSYKVSCSNIKGETLIVPCDLIAEYVTDEFINSKNEFDAIVFTAEPNDYAINNPESFAWVKGENNVISDIAIKEKSDSNKVLIGSFWVKQNEILLENIDEIFINGLKVNGEYYLDMAFKNMIGKMKVGYINLDNYFSFGTPDEYKESKYWMKGIFNG